MTILRDLMVILALALILIGGVLALVGDGSIPLRLDLPLFVGLGMLGGRLAYFAKIRHH